MLDYQYFSCLWHSNSSFIVYSSFEVSSLGFTCKASSTFSNKKSCQQIYDSDDSSGWVTKGDGVGSWVQIFLHANILISKIVYRHNFQNYVLSKPTEKQNFKDVSLEFSDGTSFNITLDDVKPPFPSEDLHYKITPPKLSSFLKLRVYSVYDPTLDVGTFANRYGLSTMRIYGSIKEGK